MTLTDAHCHLQDPRLRPHLQELLAACRARGIRRWMLNGTSEDDWDVVEELAQREEGIVPCFGLHPWWQNRRTPEWERKLEVLLRTHPKSAIGETGLDLWMSGHDIKDQRRVLAFHLELSRKLDRPLSVHCLRAWRELEQCFVETPPSDRGFLLHSFAAPRDRIPFWVERGAYFSFSPAFLHPRRQAVRESFKSIPLDRLLIETDAPDMGPPAELALLRLEDGEPRALNHPVNLLLSLKTLAEDRGIPCGQMAGHLEANVERLFSTQLG